MERQGPWPGTAVLRKFAEKFDDTKMCFMIHLLLTHKDVQIATFICGNVLNMDIIYESVAYQRSVHLEVYLQIETEYQKTMNQGKRLFKMVLHDAFTPNGTPYETLLPPS